MEVERVQFLLRMWVAFSNLVWSWDPKGFIMELKMVHDRGIIWSRVGSRVVLLSHESWLSAWIVSLSRMEHWQDRSEFVVILLCLGCFVVLDKGRLEPSHFRYVWGWWDVLLHLLNTKCYTLYPIEYCLSVPSHA